jgi:hypothetical protein
MQFPSPFLFQIMPLSQLTARHQPNGLNQLFLNGLHHPLHLKLAQLRACSIFLGRYEIQISPVLLLQEIVTFTFI